MTQQLIRTCQHGHTYISKGKGCSVCKKIRKKKSRLRKRLGIVYKQPYISQTPLPDISLLEEVVASLMKTESLSHFQLSIIVANVIDKHLQKTYMDTYD